MAFWSTNDIEPKRNFRFQVTLGAASSAPVLWWAKTVTTPSFDVSETEHDYLDNKYYFPGRVTWSEVSMTLVDPISVDAVAQTNKIIVDSGYAIKDGPTTTKSTISKAKSSNAAVSTIAPLANVKIEVLDADGVVVERWTLKGAFIKSAKYGDLDYSSDDLRTVELSLRYDYALCDNISNGQTTTNFKPV
tara:strand:+ start:1173 stop:1742 length:570 start_codon:yes stop_codon:yes gene_type:complete